MAGHPFRGRRHVPLLGVVSVLAVLLAACGSGASGVQGAAGDDGSLQKVTFRWHFVPSGSQAPLYLAKDLGYYQDEGLDVELLVGKGSQFAVNDVATNNVDFASANSNNVILGIGQGQDVVSVASWISKGAFGFFVPEDSDIRTIQDLEGKTIVSAPGTPQAALLPAVFAANNADYSSVNVINVSASALLQTYASGEGDAVVTSLPFGEPIIQPKRPSRTIAWSEAGLPLPDYSFLTSRGTLEEDPEVVRKFLRATFKGIDSASKDPEKAIDALVAANPEVERESALAQFKDYLAFYCPVNGDGVPVGQHVPADWERAVESLKQHAGLETDQPADAFYTNEFFTGDDSVAATTCPIDVGGSS